MIYKKLSTSIIEIIKIKNNINEYTKFYPNDIYPELKNIEKYKKKINIELDLVLENKLNDWVDYPEKQLYDPEKQTWKIMPFYYYGLWVDKNCEKMPALTKYLKSLKNMKLALLSVLAPNTVLKEHKGCGNHSNKVLRCHYGLRVSNNCYISVKNDDDLIGTKQSHIEDEWIVFDDSKTHFEANNSDCYKIVLIIDLKRPKYLHKGTSDVDDTKKLLEIIEYCKN
jgi:beta-hydroxylase